MIYKNVLELVGSTPMIHYNENILLKLEYFNPSNSIKDRASYFMLNEAIKEGSVDSETVIIEPTSGNTGIALAMCCAVMGLKSIIVMPENMSVERQKAICAYGAEIILTPKELGMNGAVEKAKELMSKYKNSFMPMQFSNKANVLSHEVTTAKEIFDDTNGNVDIFVAGVGTGGTIVGVAKGLKKLKSEVKIFAVEPKESPLLSQGQAGLHKIQGIGANFVPEIFETSEIDEVLIVSSDEAIEMARKLAKTKGILSGFSSGANLVAAIKLAERYPDKLITTVVCDIGDRYLSTELYEC